MGKDRDQIRSFFAKHPTVEKLARKPKNKDLAIVVEQHLLLDLISLGIVDRYPPHEIQRRDEFCTEWNFYQLKAGQRVAEIGAGDGTFSKLLAMFHPDVECWATEINSTLFEYMQRPWVLYGAPLVMDNLHFVLGNETDTGLPIGFDRIILRHTVHHFSDPSSMLSSIRKALLPNGRVCVYESFIKNDEVKDGQCAFLMTRETLIQQFKDAGFELEASSGDTKKGLLRFKVAT
ncbi:MAG: methyltransferase domain-containing protein [Saprospiraceae bacterium]